VNSFGSAMKLISSPTQRKRIRARLRLWSRDGAGGKIVRNLQALERFLPATDMRDLLLAIDSGAGHPHLDIRHLEIQFDNECHKHVMRGGAVRCPRPSLVGRAVERDVFAIWLKQTKFFHTDSQVRDFLLRLNSGGPLSASESHLLMSRFGAWVTWRDAPLNPDPFGFTRRLSAIRIRACCGLDPQRRFSGKPLFLLVYQCHSGLFLFRPTIADAGLHELFQPPIVPESRHGWTQTWPREKSLRGFKPVSRPEAIHPPESMAHMDFKFTRQVV
jgi:hypothetical protein